MDEIRDNIREAIELWLETVKTYLSTRICRKFWKWRCEESLWKETRKSRVQERLVACEDQR